MNLRRAVPMESVEITYYKYYKGAVLQKESIFLGVVSDDKSGPCCMTGRADQGKSYSATWDQESKLVGKSDVKTCQNHSKPIYFLLPYHR